MLLRRLPLAFAPLLIATSLGAQAAPGLASFGDSLSDNGNLFHVFGIPAAPYFQGRFSNGPVWLETLGPRLGVPSSMIHDRAVGGSTSDNMLNLQVVPYLASFGTVPENTTITLWIGANDLLVLLDDPTQDPTEIIGSAVTNIADALVLLLGAGAEDILVVNLPDLGLTPRVQSLNDPTAVIAASLLSQSFNTALLDATTQIEALFGVDLIEIDAFKIFADVIDNPSVFGFENTNEAAYDVVTGEVDQREAGFVFWDDIHPTGRTHRVLAHLAANIIREHETSAAALATIFSGAPRLRAPRLLPRQR